MDKHFPFLSPHTDSAQDTNGRALAVREVAQVLHVSLSLWVSVFRHRQPAGGFFFCSFHLPALKCCIPVRVTHSCQIFKPFPLTFFPLLCSSPLLFDERDACQKRKKHRRECCSCHLQSYMKIAAEPPPPSSICHLLWQPEVRSPVSAPRTAPQWEAEVLVESSTGSRTAPPPAWPRAAGGPAGRRICDLQPAGAPRGEPPGVERQGDGSKIDT